MEDWFETAGLGMFIHWDHASQQGLEISWPLVGGPWTVEAVLFGIASGLAIAAAVLAMAPLSLLLQPHEVVDALPRSDVRVWASFNKPVVKALLVPIERGAGNTEADRPPVHLKVSRSISGKPQPSFYFIARSNSRVRCCRE